jgi:anti-sigma factor RsiW
MTNPVCWLIRQRLGAFQDGELGPAARAKTSAHLTRCTACAGELAGLRRLRAALAVPAPEPGEAVWDAFWPQVRARLAAASEEPAARRAGWLPTGRPWQLAFGSTLAAVALGILAVLAPWQPAPERPGQRPAAPGQTPVASTVPAPEPGKPLPVVVQSVETADPQSSVMVFTNPESDVTVVWVFGLQHTDI